MGEKNTSYGLGEYIYGRTFRKVVTNFKNVNFYKSLNLCNIYYIIKLYYYIIKTSRILLCFSFDTFRKAQMCLNVSLCVWHRALTTKSLKQFILLLKFRIIILFCTYKPIIYYVCSFLQGDEKPTTDIPAKLHVSTI